MCKPVSTTNVIVMEFSCRRYDAGKRFVQELLERAEAKRCPAVLSVWGRFSLLLLQPTNRLVPKSTAGVDQADQAFVRRYGTLRRYATARFSMPTLQVQVGDAQGSSSRFDQGLVADLVLS